MKRIISISYHNTITPSSSSGTGYSEPNVFEIVFDDASTKKVYIDIWYIPSNKIYDRFISSVGDANNIREAFDMYVDELIKNGCCPYTKEEITKEL